MTLEADIIMSYENVTRFVNGIGLTMWLLNELGAIFRFNFAVAFRPADLNVRHLKLISGLRYENVTCSVMVLDCSCHYVDT